MSGAFDLTRTIDEWVVRNHLEHELDINMTREIDNIEPSFFGRTRVQMPRYVEYAWQANTTTEKLSLSARALAKVSGLFGKKLKQR